MGEAGEGPRGTLLATLAHCRDVAELSPSPFYVTLLDRMADDVRAGGPTWDLLGPYADQPAREYYPFRALSGVHMEVLDGNRDELAARYPSAGGDGDAEAAWPGVRDAYAGHDPDVLAELAHPLQTNETSRCGALIGGFCEISARTRMPLRAFELGASAGLNLHFDRYRYEAAGIACGPADSAVRFVDYWEPAVPPLDAPLEVVERRGCDLDPIDPASDAGRLLLESYLWPDEHERLETLRAACAIAAERPVEVDRESADEWVAARLAEPAPGSATVIFHSIFWIYPPRAVTAAVERSILAAGERASEDAPLAWLRYEEDAADPRRVEIRLRLWPGGSERLLGSGRHHRHRVHWTG